MTELIASPTILVPIDMHGINPAALEIIVGIARQRRCGLLGLILEDLRLQQVADLPFTTEIILGSGRERGLLRDSLAQRYSKVTLDTRRRLTELANRGQVALTFDQAVGPRLLTALARDKQLDIFFPARHRWRVATSAAGPSIARLGIVQSGGEQDMRVLEMSGAFARTGLVREIYIFTDKSIPPEQLRELTVHSTRVCVQPTRVVDSGALTRLIRHSPYDLLILPRDGLVNIQPDALDAALDESASEVMLVN